MSELALLSLRDVAPLGMPASLPPPPAPSGGYTFDQHLTEATQRQESEVEPGKNAVPHEPEGEFRRLELPRREDRVREPERTLTPQDASSPQAEAVPHAQPEALQANPNSPVQDDPTSDTGNDVPAEAATPPRALLAPESSPDASGAETADPIADAAALALISPTGATDGSWQQPSLNELFPEYFSGLPAGPLPQASDSPPLLDSTQLPVNTAGAHPGLSVPVGEEPIAAGAAPLTLTARERRYGFGLGKPFQGHAAVNRRHLDRFGREIPLPTTFVSRTSTASSNQSVTLTPTATMTDQKMTLQGPSVGSVVPTAIPITPTGPMGSEAVPELPVADDDTPTFGSQVAFKPQAVHLRATTPGFGDQPRGDQSFDGDQPQQPAVAELVESAVELPSDVKSRAFGSLFNKELGAIAIAPPLVEADADATLPEATPLKDAATGPLPINGLNAALTRGSASSISKGESPPARETVAFRSIATELTAKLSKDAVPEGATRLRVTLRPRELGTITIELIRQGDQLETRITTRTREALNLFEKMMPELKVQLEERGFNVRSLDLMHQQQLSRDDQGHASRDWARPNHGWEKPPLPRPLLDIPEPEHGELDLRDLADGLNLTV